MGDVSRQYIGSGPLTALAVNPSNDLAVVGGREILRVLLLTEDGIRETLNLHFPPEGNKLAPFAPTDIKWSSPTAGNLVATASTAGIAIYDLNKPSSQKLDRVISEHIRAVNRVHFHPTDSYLLLSGSQDGMIKLWDLRTRNVARATIDAKSEGVRDVQFNPLGTLELAAAFENGSVQTWDMRRPTTFDRRYNAHNGLALSLDWHVSGRLIATGGRDKMIKIWDTTHEARKPTHYIQTIASVARVAWRPGTGYEVASCSLSSDFRIYVWHIERPFIPDISLEKHDNIVSGMVWGSKETLFSCSRDNKMILHNVAKDGYQIRQQMPKSALTFTPLSDLALIADELRKSVSEGKGESEKSGDKPRSQRPGIGAARGASLQGPAVGIVCTDRIGTKVFAILAKHYITSNDNPDQSCMQNAKVAEHLGLHQTAQTWRLLQGLVSTIATPTFTDLEGTSVIQDTLRFYAEQGNTQLSCTLLLILRKADSFSVDLGNMAGLIANWFSSYIGQLVRLGLYSTAADVISSCPVSGIADLNSTGTTVYNSCTCGKAGLVQSNGFWRCEDSRCPVKPLLCCLCHKPVKGMFNWCQGCSHGGHMDCLMYWQGDDLDLACPACGHVCTDMDE